MQTSAFADCQEIMRNNESDQLISRSTKLFVFILKELENKFLHEIANVFYKIAEFQRIIRAGGQSR